MTMTTATVVKSPMDRTVGDLVAERPARSRVFSKLGIDFCCGGKKRLDEACRDLDLEVGEVLTMLDAVSQDERGGERGEEDLRGSDPEAICDHLESTHHAYLKEELPRLAGLLEKVARVHGERYPHMVEVHRAFVPFADELLRHLMKEERILFPAIRRMARGGAPMDLAAPLSVMEREHVDAGEALARFRELTAGYSPPEGACNTFRAALDGLATLEADTHLHVHKENNILFPRVRELVER